MFPPGTRVVYIGCHHGCRCRGNETQPWWWRPYGARGVVSDDQTNLFDSKSVRVDFDREASVIGGIATHFMKESDFDRTMRQTETVTPMTGDRLIYIGHTNRCNRENCGNVLCFPYGTEVVVWEYQGNQVDVIANNEMTPTAAIRAHFVGRVEFAEIQEERFASMR